MKEGREGERERKRGKTAVTVKEEQPPRDEKR